MSTIDRDNTNKNLLDVVRQQQQQVDYLSTKTEPRQSSRNLFCLTAGGLVGNIEEATNVLGEWLAEYIGYEWTSPVWVPHGTVRIVRATTSIYEGTGVTVTYGNQAEWGIETAHGVLTYWSHEGAVSTHKLDIVVPPSSWLRVIGSTSSRTIQAAYLQLWIEGDDGGGGHLPLIWALEGGGE